MDENGEYFPRIDDYSAAICEILQEAVPEIPWVEEVKGPALRADATGTMAADSSKVSAEEKADEEGTISFNVTIIVPDQSALRLENLAMKAREALNGTDIMDGHVDTIQFGIAQGQRGRNPGAAVLVYNVKACF